MISSIFIWGSIIGVVHFIVLGGLYGNPYVDKKYKLAQKNESGVKDWSGKTAKYMRFMFLGTMLEVYVLSAGYFWLRPLVPTEGISGAAALALLFTGVRVYPRFFNMWIQSTYPFRLLLVECINGSIGTFLIICGLELIQ